MLAVVQFMSEDFVSFLLLFTFFQKHLVNGASKVLVVLLAHRVASASPAEGDGFDPRGRHRNLLLMVTVLPLKLVYKMPSALKVLVAHQPCFEAALLKKKAERNEKN